MADDFEYKFKEKSYKMLLSEISLPVEDGGTLGNLLLLLHDASMSAWSNDWISSPDDSELNSTFPSNALSFCPRELQQIYLCVLLEREVSWLLCLWHIMESNVLGCYTTWKPYAWESPWWSRLGAKDMNVLCSDSLMLDKTHGASFSALSAYL